VADFGLTSEGTSKSPHHTEFARGTPGYRAPELLQEGEAVYTNKVDIWALGCILYQLVVGIKPFASDIAVLDHYRLGSSLDIKVDEMLNADLASLSVKAIHEMLQTNPASRPTASTLLDAWSTHCIVNKTKSLELMSRDSSSMLPPNLKVKDQREWTVLFTIGNISNTRAATESCDTDREFSQITLWDMSSGASIWQRQYPWIGWGSRARPTFSSDGKYFGVHHGEMSVEILDSKSGKLVMAVPFQIQAQVMAIAVSQAGVEPKAILGLLALTSDVVETYAVFDISLAYDSRGRHLFLVGNSNSGRSVGFCWDTRTRTGTGAIKFHPDSLDMSTVATPLYSFPTSSAFFRGYHVESHFLLGVFNTNTQVALVNAARISHGICGSGHQSPIVLGNEEDVAYWDSGRGRWIPAVRSTRTTNKIYKNLWKWEQTEPGGSGNSIQFKVVAKMAWDDMPSMDEIKGSAATEAGLTLILEGEKFMFLGKERLLPV